MLPTAALEYDLPESRIATRPVEPRDAARLMVVRRANPAATDHRHVRDLPDLLQPGDLLVRNITKVIPARLRGRRLDTGGKMEGLYLQEGTEAGRHEGTQAGGEPLVWEAMIKLRRLKPGAVIALHDRAGEDSGVRIRLIERCRSDEEGDGSWRVEVDTSEARNLRGAGTLQILERIGLTPLPPYIRAARKHAHEEVADEQDRTTYQTTFASADDPASVAAPTAGLHFTPELDARLRARGVRFAEVTLHVGMGTFKPVETEFVEQHPIHAEWCAVPTATGRAILETRAAGGRVIAVGTTTARTLESFEGAQQIAAGAGEESAGGLLTRLLITPGYRFRNLDALMTNFHLPHSTLMAMVGAFLGDGSEAVERLKTLYAEAIRRDYRFYSYGDAMLILP